MVTTNIHQGADWPFIQNGAVTLFWRRPVLDAAIEALRQASYTVHRIDCGTEAVLMRDLAKALHWRKHFGYEPDRLNLDALNDALGSEPCEERPRLALVFESFDGFQERDQRTAFQVLDMIEAASRDHLLHGERLLALVRTDDPQARFDGLGARAARWNPNEWLLESRRG